MLKRWSARAEEDYLYWLKNDIKTFNKINDLIDDIEIHGELRGLGKPKRLRGNLYGYCSRRINLKDRLLYRVIDNTIEILQCRTHYEI